MKPDVERKLAAIFSYPFFEAIGEALPASATPVKGWRAAVKASGSRKWGNCRLMARNTLDWATQTKNWSRGNEWNQIVEELKPPTESFVDNLLPKTSLPEQFRKTVTDNLRWDILLICLETEYTDVVNPIFYVPYLDPWYAAGHFPCGWDGTEFPEHWDGIVKDGRLMVC
jgi:hypothetical protein